MTISETIQKAIEGGWEGLGKNKRKIQYALNHIELDEQRVVFSYGDYDQDDSYITFSEILLDPPFWQSLGKAMGWEVGCSYIDCWDRCEPWNGGGKYTGYWCHTHDEVSTMPIWLKYWHCFIDHLAENKTIEEFFNQF